MNPPRRRILIAIVTAVVVAVLLAFVPRLLTRPASASANVSSTVRLPAPQEDSPLGQKLADLRLMNYYPATAAWTYMWTKWNLPQIDKDFGEIEALGANAVRLNIEPNTFGFPKPTTTMAGELAAAIRAASAHKLTVQLTLFDWWSDYSDTSDSDAWVNALLAPYRSDSEISFIDVKNEIDPSDPAAMTWLKHELPVVRQAAGSVPVTVSVTGPDILGNLASLKSQLAATPPDFYDVHYYIAAQRALATFEQAKALVAPTPLFIGETGVSTGTGLPTTVAEGNQDLYLRSVEWAARTAGLPDAAPWILQDIAADAVPSGTEVGRALDYGLYRLDGAAKPAAASIKGLYQSNEVSTTINGDFTLGSGTEAADWRTTLAGGSGTLAWDASIGHNAPGSVSLSDTTMPTSGAPAFIAAPVLQPTASGQGFELTAWAEGENATGENGIAISWFNADGGYLSTAESSFLPSGTTSWQQLQVSSTAPSAGAYALIYLKSGGNTGTVRFDDVAFTAQN